MLEGATKFWMSPLTNQTKNAPFLLQNSHHYYRTFDIDMNEKFVYKSIYSFIYSFNDLFITYSWKTMRAILHWKMTCMTER